MLNKSIKISWKIGYRCDSNILEDNYKHFSELPNPRWGWCADPFLFQYDENIYVFAEIWNYFKQRGCIGYYQLTGDKKDNEWHVVISERYHMSYPLIWNDKDGIHMCAETCGNRDLHTYDCISFPNQWEMNKVLIKNKKLVDSTFVFEKYGDLKYCFTYEIISNDRGILNRYLVKDGYINMNQKMEITSNPEIARPGGNFIKENDITYRVAQDCSVSYGRNLCFLEVISEEPYKEKLKLKISCDQFDYVPNCIGVHTYNRMNNYEVIDFRIYKFGFVNFLGTYLRLLLRRLKHVYKCINKKN